MKADPTGVLVLNAEVEKALGITGLSDHQRQLISAVTLSRPVCISDAAWNILQYPIVDKSIAVHFFSTKAPETRTTSAWMNDAGSVRTSGASIPPVRRYEARPESLENITLYEAFQNYQLKNKANIRGRKPHVGASRQRLGSRNAHRSRLPGRSGLGDYWYPVEEGELYVVSFTDPYPARDPQGFCYTLLLQKIPFRSEADLTNLGESYFDACVRHGIFSDRDTLLSVIAETWCARHLTESGEAVCDKMLDALHLDEELREIGVGDYKTAQDAVAYALRNVYAAGQAAGADAMATMARADTERRRVISEHLASELTL